MLSPQRRNPGKSRAIEDPVPDPEPASPSLPGPDPGVFHHEPDEPQPKKPEDQSCVRIAPLPFRTAL